MAESITISQLPPPFKSMQYDLLRASGLQFIQDLSGNIWTDDNIHDPGITILEMLSYAITDLGYRTNYNIKDILTTDPNAPEDIRNFYAAKEIMPNYPVTFNDYRKLMIDVEIPSTDPPNCPFVGVQNAWIEISSDNEIPFYVDEVNKTLSYTQPNPTVARSQPKVLYNVLLEFSSCEALGDLNENTLDSTLKLYFVHDPTNPPTFLPPGVTAQLPSALNGTSITMELEFPRWDDPAVDWNDPASIKANMRGVTLDFVDLPEQYTVDNYGFLPSKDVWVAMSFNLINNVDTSAIDYELNKVIYDSTNGLIALYQKKVLKINEILAAVHARLMANRNLGEDFFRYNAIKVDEIALCAEIDVTNDAVLETVQAQIYHVVERFLDPIVFFYSLQEMYAKGKTTDQIFEGPLLQHGFIDDDELTLTERRKTIHVSDLINIIMDVPGVVAIKSIQIANIVLDNLDNIPTETVKWCLDIPIEKNYVPRLSVEHSKLLFYKDQLPFRANSVKANEILVELEAADRPQKIENPDDDIHLPPGEYKDIENYYSIQEEFPLVYGISTAGLPATADVMRQAQAKQLKGYLIFFEQLLANYLSQLFHVKDLFSMNDAKDINGDPVINKTYFSQSLLNLVPDAFPLYADPTNAAAILQAMTEDQATYLSRRNRFLDHLMARFAESFNDYAMLVYEIDGPKAPADLIQDKLAFLNNYPLISSARDTGFDYKEPCEIWSIDNISGLERRVSYLCGVDKPDGSELAFGKKFDIVVGPTADAYYLDVNDGGFPTPTVHYVYSANYNTTGFPTHLAAQLGMEQLVLNGAQPEQYTIYDINNTPIPDPLNPPSGIVAPFHFTISCNGVAIGVNPSPDYSTLTGTGSISDTINNVIIPIFLDEFYNNPESNRYNFECFMEKYVTFAVNDPTFQTIPPCPPEYTYHFTLTDGDPDNAKSLLTGQVEGLIDETDPASLAEQAAANKDRLIMDMLRTASDIKNYRYAFDITNPMSEVFTVVNNCGDVIATSFEEDFNQFIQSILVAISGLSSPDNNFAVVDSTGNDGNYTALSIVIDPSNPQRLVFNANPSPTPIPSPIGDGFIRFDIDKRASMSALLPNVIDANTADNYFTVDKSLSRVIFPGEKITIIYSGNIPPISPLPDDGDYTVVKVVPSGVSDSLIYVKETIPSTTPGATVMMYSKLLPIVAVDNISNNIFYIKPGADELAAQELADWINAKFFSHEGMHVIEHVLLRPKYNMLGPPTAISAANNNQLINPALSAQVTFSKPFALTAVDTLNRTFTFSGNFVGDIITPQPMSIVGSPFNDKTYTITAAVYHSGPNTTEVTVFETIPDATVAGNLEYSKTYTIQSVSGSNLDMISFTDSFFVSPANGVVIITYLIGDLGNKTFQVTANSSVGSLQTLTLDSTVVQLGKATFLKQFALSNVDPVNKTFSFSGNYAGDVQVLQSIRIVGSPFNDNTYTIRSATFDGVNTVIKIYETIPDASIIGNLQYSKTLTIQSVSGVNMDTITVMDPFFVAPANGDVIITNSFEEENDGRFHMSGFLSLGGNQYKITFDTRVAVIVDDFLPIELRNDCIFCQFDDPYSFIVSIVLPAWQGRFFNQDFRTFFDRTLRLECPAHLVLNVCWIDCKQMGDFEVKYKRWLLENAKENPDPARVSVALNEFIKVLTELRSVYPEGILHDCNSDSSTDPTPENAIVLNSTVLGNL